MPRQAATLAVPAAVAAFLRLWDLSAVGFGNQYYAATVKSMTTSLAAFLYGSFDPLLFVSVDKPAPGLWPQAIAAEVFGFASLSLLIPQALAGTLSVVVLGRIVAREHGAAAGAIAALALAVAPVAVAVDRNNTMDAELVLVLLLAVWCALRSFEGGARWLIVAGVLVGIGFEIKMSQAYLVFPALALTYLAAARTRRVTRVLHVAALGLVTLAVSAIWIVFVDLTPADERPYVGSSLDNTALELAIGHNGLERLPQELLFWRRPGRPAGPPPVGVPIAPGQAPPGVVGPNDEAGERGPLRLFNMQLAGQLSWFMPLALAGAVAAFAKDGRRRPLTRAQASVLLWATWLVPAAILFSWSGIFHRYYLVMLAPPLAALVGAGVTSLVALARTSLAWRVAAVGTAIATAALHVTIVGRAEGYAAWLVPLALAGALAAAVGTLPVRRWQRAAASVAIASLFAAPIVWAGTTLIASSPGLPFAGPELLVRGGPAAVPAAPRGPTATPPSPLFDFLAAERRGERWLAATSSQSTAATWMLRADVAVMALGGFSGGDPILTPAALEGIVRAGDLRFVLIEDRMPPDLGAWVRSRCVGVPPSRYGGVALLPPGPPGQAPPGVFDCARVRQVP